MLPFKGAIARSFWGKSWCTNLESYSDYSNRLGRGRSYVRSGTVIDLRVDRGEVRARVQGTRLYSVEIAIRPVTPTRWKALVDACRGDVSSVADLLSGALPPRVMTAVCDHERGLFPAPKEIEFKCSCPDWASMCKHVAATLYGVGARLDERPELLFVLRGADHEELIGEAAVATVHAATLAPAGARLLDASSVADIFGLTLDAAPQIEAPRAPRPEPATKAAKPKRAKTSTAKISAAKTSAAKAQRPSKPEPAPSIQPLAGLEDAMRDAMARAFAPPSKRRAAR